MIDVQATQEGYEVLVLAREDTVYLDHAPLRMIAENAKWSERLATAILANGTLFFSLIGMTDLSENRGSSLASVRGFFERIREHWVLIDPNPVRVAQREALFRPGGVSSHPAAEVDLLLEYYAKVLTYRPDEQRRPSLRALVDMLENEPMTAESLARGKETLAPLVDVIPRLREDCKLDPKALDRRFPSVELTATNRVTFLWHELIRRVVRDSTMGIERNDILDLLHAVVPTAFAKYVVLDKRWATLLAQIPRREEFARVFAVREIPDFLDEISPAN